MTTKFEFNANERSSLILGLQHSLRYLHHCYLNGGPSSREFWLERIRETYAVYHRVDFDLSRDRYSSVVKHVTKERI